MSMFEPFHLAIALCPIAVYLILMGAIRFLNRPLVVSGGRELMTLAFAVSGWIAIGPMELFFPRTAMNAYGWIAWVMMLMLYLLSVMLLIMTSRPRLVVYGLDAQELNDQLRVLFAQLDPETQWLGENVQSPGLGISAIIENAGPGRISQLLAVSHRQSIQGWIVLERALVHQLHYVQVNTSRMGIGLIALGIGILAAMCMIVLRDPDSTSQAMRDMLRL